MQISPPILITVSVHLFNLINLSTSLTTTFPARSVSRREQLADKDFWVQREGGAQAQGEADPEVGWGKRCRAEPLGSGAFEHRFWD